MPDWVRFARFDRSKRARGEWRKWRAKHADRADGADKIVRVPVGTVAHDVVRGRIMISFSPGRRCSCARGETVGWEFSFSVEPEYDAESGESGASRRGGNARGTQDDSRYRAYRVSECGKSSLLNALTEASSKVGNYRFTTLEPISGCISDTIIADIPGLIEGASEGRVWGTSS